MDTGCFLCVPTEPKTAGWCRIFISLNTKAMEFGAGRRGCLRQSIPPVERKTRCFIATAKHFISRRMVIQEWGGWTCLFPAVNRMVPGRKRKTLDSPSTPTAMRTAYRFFQTAEQRCLLPIVTPLETSICGNLSCRGMLQRNRLHCGAAKCGMRIQRVPFKHRFRCWTALEMPWVCR